MSVLHPVIGRLEVAGAHIPDRRVLSTAAYAVWDKFLLFKVLFTVNIWAFLS